MNRNPTMLAGVALLALAAAAPAYAADKVTFGTNWLAEAEHGGFYQAVADGTYAKYGLDVTVVQGGPQSPNEALLISGKVDFFMGSQSQLYDDVKEGRPMISVGAVFQKDPQVLMAHPDAGIETFGDLAKATTIFMGNDAITTYFAWMKQNFPGFKDEQFKPYTFNPAPFMADKNSAQQGYITSEPYAVEHADGGFTPKLFLLADAGYDPYSELIETTQKMVDTNPDLVQRFVDATIIGWANYLYGDNAAANARIKKDNPEMTDARIAYSIAKMKEYGIVDSGDTMRGGIGAMTDARMKSFFDKMVASGVTKAGIDYKKAYSLQFINKGVGVDLRK